AVLACLCWSPPPSVLLCRCCCPGGSRQREREEGEWKSRVRAVLAAPVRYVVDGRSRSAEPDHLCLDATGTVRHHDAGLAVRSPGASPRGYQRSITQTTFLDTALAGVVGAVRPGLATVAGRPRPGRSNAAHGSMPNGRSPGQRAHVPAVGGPEPAAERSLLSRVLDLLPEPREPVPPATPAWPVSAQVTGAVLPLELAAGGRKLRRATTRRVPARSGPSSVCPAQSGVEVGFEPTEDLRLHTLSRTA